MKFNTSISIIFLTILSLLAMIFHFLILIKIIPYNITWGGNLKTDEEMYVFVSNSIIVNLFFIFVILQKGEFIKVFFGKKTISIIIWIFFVIFSLNTIGNIFAKTMFEKGFTILTLLNSILLWKINTNDK